MGGDFEEVGRFSKNVKFAIFFKTNRNINFWNDGVLWRGTLRIENCFPLQITTVQRLRMWPQGSGYEDAILFGTFVLEEH